MHRKRWPSIIPSIALIIILILSTVNLTASDSNKNSSLTPQHEPKENEKSGFPSGWSDDKALTPTTNYSGVPSISINDSNVHVLYRMGFDQEIYYLRSIDRGMSFSNPIMLSSGGFGGTLSPVITSNYTNIHVIWDESRPPVANREVVYRNSTDNGEIWNDMVPLSPDDDMNSQNPSIAVNSSNIHVVWEDYRSNNQYNIYYKRSIDGGITWDDGLGNVGQDRQLTFVTWPATDVLPYIAADENGVHLIYTTWTTDFGCWETMYMNSTDNGATWSTPVMLSAHDAWHSDGQAIDINGSGGVHVVWWESKYGNQEISYRNSSDEGATWNPEVRLTYDGNYSQQPNIAVNESHVFVAWQDDRDHYDYVGDPSGAYELYFIESFDSGATWGPETRFTFAVNQSAGPMVVMDTNYIHVTWMDNRTNGSRLQIFYKRYPDFPAEPEYNISLLEGWNLVSLPLEQSDESINQVLSSIDGKWDYIQTYDAINGIWLSNATFKPDQLNDFSTLNHKQGFWINIIEPNVNLTVRGLIPASTSINLYAGWNLIGYPSLNTETVANALWGTGADKVEVFDPAEPYRIREVGPTYVMKPGEGYWIHVVADMIWVVDW